MHKLEKSSFYDFSPQKIDEESIDKRILALDKCMINCQSDFHIRNKQISQCQDFNEIKNIGKDKEGMLKDVSAKKVLTPISLGKALKSYVKTQQSNSSLIKTTKTELDFKQKRIRTNLSLYSKQKYKKCKVKCSQNLINQQECFFQNITKPIQSFRIYQNEVNLFQLFGKQQNKKILHKNNKCQNIIKIKNPEIYKANSVVKKYDVKNLSHLISQKANDYKKHIIAKVKATR